MNYRLRTGPPCTCPWRWSGAVARTVPPAARAFIEFVRQETVTALPDAGAGALSAAAAATRPPVSEG